MHNELDAFDDGSDGRITLSDPDVYLSLQLAVSLGMAAHELTTNAAIDYQIGRVRMHCSVPMPLEAQGKRNYSFFFFFLAR